MRPFNLGAPGEYSTLLTFVTPLRLVETHICSSKNSRYQNGFEFCIKFESTFIYQTTRSLGVNFDIWNTIKNTSFKNCTRFLKNLFTEYIFQFIIIHCDLLALEHVHKIRNEERKNRRIEKGISCIIYEKKN